MATRYSLADYTVSFVTNNPSFFGNISVGGQGSILDSITVSYQNSIWDVETFSTGGYVHNKNLNRSGTVSISLSQLSDQVAQFRNMCNYYYNNDYNDSFTITITNRAGTGVCTCTDCYVQKIPDQGFEQTANRQSWTFVCGKIEFK